MKKQLADYAKEMIVKHPHLKSVIGVIYLMCINDIEDGGSEQHECELAMEDIKQKIEGDVILRK